MSITCVQTSALWMWCQSAFFYFSQKVSFVRRTNCPSHLQCLHSLQLPTAIAANRQHNKATQKKTLHILLALLNILVTSEFNASGSSVHPDHWQPWWWLGWPYVARPTWAPSRARTVQGATKLRGLNNQLKMSQEDTGELMWLQTALLARPRDSEAS
jgi:hypothetical protein